MYPGDQSRPKPTSMAGLQQERSVIACIFLYLPHLFAVVCLLLCVLQHSAKFLHLQEHMCGQIQVAVAGGGGGGGEEITS